MAPKKKQAKTKKKAASRKSPKKTSKEPQKRTPKRTSVTLVEDPFQLSQIEVADAQTVSEPLELDTELELREENEVEQDFERLEKVMDEQSQESLKELKELAEGKDEVIDPEKELQKQIEEDQAIEAELAKADSVDDADPEIQEALPKALDSGELDLIELQSCIEALLIVSDKPLSLKKLKELVGPDFSTKTFKQAIKAMQERYQEPHHGFELVEISGGFQYRTKPGRAPLTRKLGKVQTHKLSRGAMESLAIVAYRQPVMKEDIDKIRGVDSSYFIRGLLDKKLIHISGRSELPGRPMLYSTTSEFLEIFGLKNLQSLPPLPELERMMPASESENPENAEKEDPKVKQLRELVGKMNSKEERIDYDPEADETFLTEIRQKVKDIPTSTPYLEEQRVKEKEAKKAAELTKSGESSEPSNEPPSESPAPPSEAAESTHPDPEPPSPDIPPRPEILGEEETESAIAKSAD